MYFFISFSHQHGIQIKFRRSQQNSIPAIHPLGICIPIPPGPCLSIWPGVDDSWLEVLVRAFKALRHEIPIAQCATTALFKDPAGLGERIRPQANA